MVGQAVATYLADFGMAEVPVGIAYDARASSPAFAAALADVLTANGIAVVRMKRDTPTPVLAWMIAEEDLAGGLMITASHNPPEYNGVKFITADGAPALPPVTDALEDRIATPQSFPVGSTTTVTTVSPVDAYLGAMRDLVDASSLDGLQIAYDPMHGCGRGVTDRLLEEAGASVTKHRATHDPTFGGSAPEPAPAHLTTLIDTVVNGTADLGIANDGDADRLAVVTPGRGYVDESLLFAAIYDYLLDTQRGPAVRTVSTSSIVDRVAAAHGESVIETRVGFKWVAAAMREHDALMGGEESGGFTTRGHVREKDGVYMALLTAAMSADEPLDKRIDRLLQEHGNIVQDKISVDCPDTRKQSVINSIGEALPETFAGSAVASVSDVDGYKVTLSDGGWILVRPSGTEPKLRIYAEAANEARVTELLAAGEAIVEPLV